LELFEIFVSFCRTGVSKFYKLKSKNYYAKFHNEEVKSSQTSQFAYCNNKKTGFNGKMLSLVILVVVMVGKLATVYIGNEVKQQKAL